MPIDQPSRVVVINGASGGLGPAVVQSFADTGSKLVLTARGQEELERLAGNLALKPEQTMLFPADLTQLETVATLVQAVEDHFGSLDVVVHVTGGFRGGQPVHQIDPASWQSMLELNLHTAFFMAQNVLPGMLQRGYGKLIFVSSRSASQPSANLAEYTISKTGLDMLVRILAEETRQHGINVNAVAPSVIDTPANRTSNPKADYSRWVTPESIAGVIHFLASDAARDIHGAIVPVYGRA